MELTSYLFSQNTIMYRYLVSQLVPCYELRSTNGPASHLPQVSSDALDMVIDAAPSTTWVVAEIWGAVKYLRGSKELVMPPQFRRLFSNEMLESVDLVETSIGGL